MSEAPTKTDLAAYVVKRLPEVIRRGLLGDEAFNSKYGLLVSSTVTIAEGFNFDREALYSAAQQAIATSLSVEISDAEGNKCTVEFFGDDVPRVVVTRGPQRVIATLLVLLAADRDLRVKALDSLSSSVRLPLDASQSWLLEVERAPLSASQIDRLSNDIGHTMVVALESAAEEVKSGKFRVDSLIPEASSYYQQFLPNPERGTNLADYVSGSLFPFFRRELQHDPRGGLLRALALAGSDLLVPLDIFEAVGDEVVLETISNERELTDPFSIIGAVSICLHRLEQNDLYRAAGVALLDRLLGEKSDTGRSCELFSASFILAGARLSQLQHFRDRPLFFRRLATFGQASLSTRILLSVPLSSTEFYNWCFQTHGMEFFISALLDKSEAPRWRPEWIAVDQIQNELLGRLLHLQQQYPNASHALGLPERIGAFQVKIGKAPGAWQPLYPGPLEGALSGDRPGLVLRPEMIEHIRESTVDKVGTERCMGIAVVSPIWLVPDQLINEATEELDRSPIPDDEKGRNAFRFVLGGLAHLAGLNHSTKLSNLVASLSLRGATNKTNPFEYVEVVLSTIEAAAAFVAHDERVAWIGNVVTQFSFAATRKEDATFLGTVIDALSKYDPAVEKKLLRAKAAIAAFCKSSSVDS